MTGTASRAGRFSREDLAWRGLRHFRALYAALAVAVATSAAILTGALAVGDSVRGSLAGRVRERLGAIDSVVVGSSFCRRDLASELAAASHVIARCVPVILLDGAVVRVDDDGQMVERAGGVRVLGVPDAFWELWTVPRVGAPPADVRPDGRRGLINASLARALGAGENDRILVHTERVQSVPAEHALGDRRRESSPLPLDVGAVLPDAGLAVFDLQQAQSTARNVFVSLETLAAHLGRTGKVNALLVAHAEGAGASEVRAVLADDWRLEDVGLALRVDSARGYAALESEELVLAERIVERARSAARSAGVQSLEVLTYLANSIDAGERSIPYSTVTALGSWIAPYGERESTFIDAGGALAEGGGIVLNSWAAEELGAGIGDTVSLRYFVLRGESALEETSASFQVRAITPLAGAAADPGWTPHYPGISEKTRLREWDPPFPVALSRIRDQDEEYWKEHRATPKAFLRLGDGRRLWRSRFGDVTSLRIRPMREERTLEDVAEGFRKELRATLTPSEAGLRVLEVKESGLRAATSGTDFSGLFVGFSFFLMVSAVALLSLVFRLGCEMRASELGLLTASGFARRDLYLLLMTESGAVVIAGTLAGALAGLGYAGLLIAGLRTIWSDAVGAPFLRLHVSVLSMSIGAVLTVLLSFGTIFLVCRRLARLPAVGLLRGVTTSSPLGARRTAHARLAAVVAFCGALAGALLILAGASDFLGAASGFFGGAACLLVAGIAGAHAIAVGRRANVLVRSRRAALFLLGARNGNRRPARSLLTLGLLACATFLIVTVSSNRRDPRVLEPRLDSGNGGFALVARSTVPLVQSLSSQDGCEELGLDQETGQILLDSEVYSFRERPGDDASCLNLYRPQNPRLLGVGRAFRERGGFAWSGSIASTPAEHENPWRLLERSFEDGAIPAIGDASTVKWILHSALGEDIEIDGDDGAPLRLRLVALLSHSIFQRELLIAEEAFVDAFPERGGANVFVMAGEEQDMPVLAEGLERNLVDFGFDVDRSGDLLASFQAVENTYLSTFLLLGGLGLLLGTVGLGTVLYRNTLERRGELALLRAVGFPRAELGWMVLSETVFLLVAGLAVGTAAALAGVIPFQLAGAGLPGAGIPWLSLAVAVLAIFATGLGAALVSLRAALRTPLLPALRSEA